VMMSAKVKLLPVEKSLYVLADAPFMFRRAS
jgi:hypothetical protein